MINQGEWSSSLGGSHFPCIMIFDTLIQITSHTYVQVIILLTPEYISTIFHLFTRRFFRRRRIRLRRARPLPYQLGLALRGAKLLFQELSTLARHK